MAGNGGRHWLLPLIGLALVLGVDVAGAAGVAEMDGSVDLSFGTSGVRTVPVAGEADMGFVARSVFGSVALSAGSVMLELSDGSQSEVIHLASDESRKAGFGPGRGETCFARQLAWARPIGGRALLYLPDTEYSPMAVSGDAGTQEVRIGRTTVSPVVLSVAGQAMC